MSIVSRDNKTVPNLPPAEAKGYPGDFDWRTVAPSFLDGENLTFRRELITYRERIDEILEHLGDYVIISGDRVVGFHSSLEEASQAAFDEFGDELVMIKKVVEREVVRRLGRV